MHFATRWLRRADTRLLIALLLATFATGCVTRSTYNEVVGDLESERDALQRRVTDLERSNKSLDQERTKLLDSMEDLRIERETLSTDVAKLRKTKDLLTTHLQERDAKVAELSKLESTYRGLVSDLESEVSSGQIQIEQLREGIRLNLAQDILFRSGRASLEPSGQAVLRKVAAQLADQTHSIEVQGHTDNVPLSRALESRWGTNWELASARASSVVRLFQGSGIDPSRLTVVSKGEFAPVASNDDPRGRARNRRIEIRLKPVEDPVGEAASAPAPTETPASGS